MPWVVSHEKVCVMNRVLTSACKGWMSYFRVGNEVG